MENNDQDKARLAQQYDKLASKFNELYLAGKARGRESMTEALDIAHKQMTALGEFSAEQGEELKKYLSRDPDQTISDEKTKETLTYKTGEMTSAGTLTCKACGQSMQLKHTGHVPPCSKCSGTLFSKGY